MEEWVGVGVGCRIWRLELHPLPTHSSLRAQTHQDPSSYSVPSLEG